MAWFPNPTILNLFLLLLSLLLHGEINDTIDVLLNNRHNDRFMSTAAMAAVARLLAKML